MTNFHQHSTYCDGRDAIKDVAAFAYAKGFSALGFSGHAPILIDVIPDPLLHYDWLIQQEQLAQYIKDVRSVGQEYAGRLPIFLGLEADYFDDAHHPGAWKPYELDYCIGSIHFLPSRTYRVPFLPLDSKGKSLEILLREYGSGEALYRACFQQNIRMIRTKSIDILGHMDLFSKVNQNKELFDNESISYLQAAEEVFACALEHDVVVEINTGYMARKGFDEPFPNYNLIELGARMGVQFCLSSDCHAKEDIDFAFAEVKSKIKALGVHSLAVLTGPHQWEIRDI